MLMGASGGGKRGEENRQQIFKDIKFSINFLSYRIYVWKRASTFRMTDFISRFGFNSQTQGKLIEKPRYFFLSYGSSSQKSNCRSSSVQPLPNIPSCMENVILLGRKQEMLRCRGWSKFYTRIHNTSCPGCPFNNLLLYTFTHSSFDLGS